MIVQAWITAEDIVEGERRNCEKCPATRAVARLVQPGVDVAVYDWYVLIGNHEVSAPRVLQVFIRHFDTYRPVAPLAFPLDIPDEYLREEFRA